MDDVDWGGRGRSRVGLLANLSDLAVDSLGYPMPQAASNFICVQTRRLLHMFTGDTRDVGIICQPLLLMHGLSR